MESGTSSLMSLIIKSSSSIEISADSIRHLELILKKLMIEKKYITKAIIIKLIKSFIFLSF